MKLGLVRHFKVITNEKPFLSSKEFTQAMANYDVAKVKENGLKINAADWDICYCSTLSRAVKTAETIFNGKIILSDLLVEVPISPFTNWNIKLPLSLWHIGARIAWYKSHSSQKENIFATRERINKFYETINKNSHEKILIVSHGYFLRMFYEEMKKKGFTGEVDLNIQNGKLYLIED
ncbi:MAG: histidine phosphatase family protein [Ignavibacteriae bacterium]|nr:histidine phosphatase family protein [Ignavibacteriota bacterium]